MTFNKENKILRQQVDALGAANQTLDGVHNRLDNLNNVEGINKIRGRVTNMSRKWTEVQQQRERDVLYKVFDRFEHDKRGLDRTAFETFLSLIPCHYKERFHRLGTFEKLSGGTGYVNDEDFKLCLDVFAEMTVDNVDIEFEITKVKSIHKQKSDEYKDEDDIDDEEPQFMKQVTVVRRSKRGTQFRQFSK